MLFIKKRMYEQNITHVVSGDDVTPIKVIIHGIDDSVDKVEMINLLKNELSTDNIIIKSAEKSCIVLFTETKTMALQNYSLFQMEICCLIEKLFQSCNFTCKADKHIYAVVTSAEGIIFAYISISA